MRRLLSPDAYGVLLLMIIASLVLTAFGGRVGTGGVLVQAACLLYGQWISRLPRRWWWVTGSLATAAIALGLAATITDRAWQQAAAAAAAVLLAAATIVVILRRIVRHLAVTPATVAGAVSVYLLAGLAFGYGYALVAAVTGEPFFPSVEEARTVDYLYFSFSTLTTVGYGDLAAGSDFGRMLAVAEALLGQIYLVTVVALAVANLGRDRRR